MEDSQFDQVTTQLARPVSRRTVFKATVPEAAGGVGALLTFGRSSTQNTLPCHGAGTPCAPVGHNNECCTGF
jgi:hypothetical protein